MVESTRDEGIEGFLTGVTTGSVTAVVTEGDCFGESDIEPDGARDAGGDLGDLEGVREASTHVVLGKDEHLGLTRQAAKRC